MKRCALITVIFILLVLCFPPLVRGGDGGYRYFKHYTRETYKKSPQNWWIRQDKRGIIYVGNNSAVLEYDGTSWQSLAIPNRAVRSLGIGSDGTLYIGGNKEFGYFSTAGTPARGYVSLTKLLTDEEKKFQGTWKTHGTPEGVYFQTKEILFRYAGGTIKSWKTKTGFNF
ncbi:MAG: histidine kinase, partial [bacterium]|nr:histidine kinase [bacterium]